MTVNKLPLTRQQLKDLAGVLLKTQPVELTCDEWLAEIAPYAEGLLSGRLPENAHLVEHHLDICGECREEFEALLAVLRAGGIS